MMDYFDEFENVMEEYELLDQNGLNAATQLWKIIQDDYQWSNSIRNLRGVLKKRHEKGNRTRQSNDKPNLFIDADDLVFENFMKQNQRHHTIAACMRCGCPCRI